MIKEKKRLGIYGGTFSPPHLGHIRAANAFLSSAKLDELIIMPAFMPPHKENSGMLGADMRLEMCRIAFSKLPRTNVSDFEIIKGGKSYTYITLSELSAKDRELFFLVGTDMFLTLDRWKNPEIIFSLAKIALVRRESDAEVQIQINQKIAEYEEKFGAEIVLVDSSVTEISSSELRDAIGFENSTSYFLTKEVKDFIDFNALYIKDFSDEELSALRAEVKLRLGEKRFSHTVGVELAVEKIADFCLPYAKSALRAAALLHDIAKEYSEEELLNILAVEPDMTEEDLKSPKLYHAFAAPAVIKRDFPDFATKEILSAAYNHTTGREGMSLFEEIIFVADYIEQTREYPECVLAREKLYSSLDATSRDLSIEALHKCAMTEILNTESHLMKNGTHLNSRTLKTKKYIEQKINKS